LYVVLYGRYPFYDTTPARLFAKIRQAQIHLADEAGISFEARLLIRCLLRRDPTERPSAMDILAHPWLQSGDRLKISSRRLCISGSMINSAAGLRLALIDREANNDHRVPCVDSDKTKSGKLCTGNARKEGRRLVESDEPAVPSQ
jgi:serine/threonine protein kinase